MKPKTLLLLSTLIALPAQVQADERQWLSNGDRLGVTYYVFELKGVGTAEASASGRVDRIAAQEYCELNDMKADCVETVLKEHEGKVARASADCIKGTLQATDGKTYTLAGKWTTDVGAGRTKWKNTEGRIVGQDNASGGLGLSQNWEVLCPEGNAKYGKDVRTPVAEAPAQQTGPEGGPLQSAVALVDPSDLSGSVWDHNGSEVRIDEDRGLIVYETPKASIRSVIPRGTVLFRGRLGYPRPGARIQGTAYAFKTGCRPAEYPVSGSYAEGNAAIVLRGSGPVWNGCSYTLSPKSKHSTLRFESMISP